MSGALGAVETTCRRLVDWAAEGPRRTALLILIVALGVVIPGLWAMPVTDRDEARFAQASKQMLETGDVIDIRFQDQPRWKKPAGIYWMQAAAVHQVGGGVEAGIWAYRLPSVVAAILAALLVPWAARPLIGPRGAVLAGLMMATTVLLAIEGNIAKTDAALAASAVAVFGALANLMIGQGGRFAALIFWVAIAVSILLKGPIVPAIAILSLIAFGLVRRRWPPLGRLRPLPGIILAAAMVAPWLIAIWVVSDGAFFAESLGRDLGAKMVSGQEKHWGPPGLYTLLVWATLWPWAALIPLAVPGLWARRREAWLILAAGWVVPFWIVLELVPTKLPHYVLPLYPALLIALAAWIDQPAETRRWQRRVSAGLVLIPALGVAGGAMILPAVLEGRIVWPAVLLAIIGAGAAALAAQAAMRGRLVAQIGASVIAALTLYPAALQFAIPALDTAFPSPRMAAAIAQHRPCASGPAFSIGYREPSLVFLTETATRLEGADAASAALASDPGAMVLVESRWREQIKVDAPLVVRARLGYFNYNRGKPETAELLTRDDPRWDACAVGGG